MKPTDNTTTMSNSTETDLNIYEYDDRGNKISETYPSGRKVHYKYDEQNNLTSMETLFATTYYANEGQVI